MDVRHLDLLRELADRGSVTAVAAATHRTPSAVSQQLRSAERSFGVPLVEQAGRGVRLTEAGRVLAAAGRDVAKTVSQAQAAWEAFRGEPSGTVTIAALPSAATFLLPDVLGALASTHIDVRLTDLDIAEAAYANEVVDHDIVIAHSMRRPPRRTGVRTVPLAREPLDIAMSAGHPLAAQTAVSAADVAAQPWIGVPEGFPFDTVRQALETAADRDIDVIQRVRDNRLIEALVGRGGCVALLPRFTTPTGGDIVLRPLAGVPTGRHVFALVRTDRAERRAVRRVVALLTEIGARFDPPPTSGRALEGTVDAHG